jgi:hypothetical protein
MHSVFTASLKKAKVDVDWVLHHVYTHGGHPLPELRRWSLIDLYEAYYHLRMKNLLEA